MWILLLFGFSFPYMDLFILEYDSFRGIVVEIQLELESYIIYITSGILIL